MRLIKDIERSSHNEPLTKVVPVFLHGNSKKTTIMNNINIEAMTEILHEQGVIATPEQIAQIVKDYDLHIELSRESASHQFVGRKEECGECRRLKYELAEVTKERDAYHNSVKVRRSASRVWIEDGDVRYEK